MKPPTPAQVRALQTKIMASPTYAKAYKDLDFLDREELRPIRLQLELLKPEMALAELDVRSTIVVFGSARIDSPEEAKAKLAVAQAKARRAPRDRKAAAALAHAGRMVQRARYYDGRFGEMVTRASQADKRRDFVIVTGGGPGIMEAANRGAWEAKGKSIGLNITLPHEQAPNPYITPELSFQFHYFALRKMHFLMRAKAMVAFPGGFGTFDELFETLTLIQTGKKHAIPIILFGPDFWKKVVNFEYLAHEGVISHADLALFKYVETAEQAWKVIQDFWRAKGGIGARRRKTVTSGHVEEEDAR
ncbi:MAG: Rossmann fold nucleotide-binding protein [Elusimicrobia bacterium]|nr:MAG: Rossmann fold nucleotide-binding protein [Elusimicrobiota bacterium]